MVQQSLVSLPSIDSCSNFPILFNMHCTYVHEDNTLSLYIDYTINTIAIINLWLSEPGFEGGGGESTGMFQLGIILVLWIVIALLLFIFRSVQLFNNALLIILLCCSLV